MNAIQLCFFRHGIAVERGDPSVSSDADRPLTEQGIRKTRAAAAGLERLGVGFDKILTSPWLRASQTADILAQTLGLSRVETLPELAGDCSVDELLDALAGRHGRATLLVGHQPLLGAAAGELLAPGADIEIDLKKSGACAVEVDALPPRSRATLLWLLTSKQLRRIGK